MNERSTRRPVTFKLDDPHVVVTDPGDEAGSLGRGNIRVTPEMDSVSLPVPVDEPAVPARKGFRWGTLFWSSLAGLVVLGTGLGIVRLIDDLFARSEGLGFLGLALTALLVLASIVIAVREIAGLARLAAAAGGGRGDDVFLRRIDGHHAAPCCCAAPTMSVGRTCRS